MKLLSVALFLLVAVNSGYGQHPLPDSIAQRFSHQEADSNYVLQLNSLATTYLKTNPALSRNIAAYLIEFAPKIKFARGYARALTVMGNSYWYEGVYEFAQNYYLLAARQYQGLKDTVGLSQVFNNIGEVNKRLGENKKALDYLQRSMDLKKNDSTRDITLYNIGELYVTTGDYDKATDFINRSMALAEQNHHERVIAYNDWTIARIKIKQGKEDEADEYFEKAEALWIKLGETRSLIQTYHDMASSNRKRNNIALAQQYAQKSLALAKTMRVPDLRITTYLEYARLDSTIGNYKSAFENLMRHNALKDSVYNLLKSEQIARVEAIYENEIHEKENSQLRAENALREAELGTQKSLVTAITVGLLVSGALVWALVRQRRKILKANDDLKERHVEIHDQKNAIEEQAAKLLLLNERLQELNRSLEVRIDERTRQLKVQNQILSDYAFINAHKLRAPVASILGLINLLEQVDRQEFDEILGHLKTSSYDLDRMTREIGQTFEGAMVPDKQD